MGGYAIKHNLGSLQIELKSINLGVEKELLRRVVGQSEAKDTNTLKSNML